MPKLKMPCQVIVAGAGIKIPEGLVVRKEQKAANQFAPAVYLVEGEFRDVADWLLSSNEIKQAAILPLGSEYSSAANAIEKFVISLDKEGLIP